MKHPIFMIAVLLFVAGSVYDKATALVAEQESRGEKRLGGRKAGLP